MEHESFIINVPQHEHPEMRRKASLLDEVKLHTDKKPGHVVPPEGQGLEYDYELIPNTDEVRITITKNPNNVPAHHVKAKIEEGLEKLRGYEG